MAVASPARTVPLRLSSVTNWNFAAGVLAAFSHFAAAAAWASRLESPRMFWLFATLFGPFATFFLVASVRPLPAVHVRRPSRPVANRIRAVRPEDLSPSGGPSGRRGGPDLQARLQRRGLLRPSSHRPRAEATLRGLRQAVEASFAVRSRAFHRRTFARRKQSTANVKATAAGRTHGGNGMLAPNPHATFERLLIRPAVPPAPQTAALATPLFLSPRIDPGRVNCRSRRACLALLLGDLSRRVLALDLPRGLPRQLVGAVAEQREGRGGSFRVRGSVAAGAREGQRAPLGLGD